MKKSPQIRNRNFAFLIYPESAPANWIDILAKQKIPFLVSPLHEPDTEHNKPHYHVLLMFDGVKSVPQVTRFLQDLFGQVILLADMQPHYIVSHCESVQSKRAYIRYLIHFDDPDKQQFSGYEDIQVFNCSFDLESIFECDGVSPVLLDILQFVDDNFIVWYSDLVKIARFEYNQWLGTVISSRSFLIDYMKSLNASTLARATSDSIYNSQPTSTEPIALVDDNVTTFID